MTIVAGHVFLSLDFICVLICVVLYFTVCFLCCSVLHYAFYICCLMTNKDI